MNCLVREGTYPEGLLAQEIGMPGPCPQTLCNKPTFRISRCPLDIGPRPFILLNEPGVLESLEGILLIVCSKLESEIDKGKSTEDAV